MPRRKSDVPLPFGGATKEEPQHALIAIRVTLTDKDQIERIAKHLRMSVSGYARWVLFAHATGKAVPPLTQFLSPQEMASPLLAPRDALEILPLEAQRAPHVPSRNSPSAAASSALRMPLPAAMTAPLPLPMPPPQAQPMPIPQPLQLLPQAPALVPLLSPLLLSKLPLPITGQPLAAFDPDNRATWPIPMPMPPYDGDTGDLDMLPPPLPPGFTE